MNKLFPEWDDANEVIEELVEGVSKVKIYQAGFGVNVVLFDSESSNIVPKDYRLKLQVNAQKFIEDLQEKLKVDFVEKHYIGKAMTEETRAEIQKTFSRVIKLFEDKNSLDLKKVVKGYFGVEEYEVFKDKFQKIQPLKEEKIMNGIEIIEDKGKGVKMNEGWSGEEKDVEQKKTNEADKDAKNVDEDNEENEDNDNNEEEEE